MKQAAYPQAAWLNTNPVLPERVIGFELDTLKIKIGDGETEWSSLPYLEGGTEVYSKDETDLLLRVGTEGIGYVRVGDNWEPISPSNVPTFNQDTTGNSGTTDKLKNSIDLSIAGSIKSFDGSTGVSWSKADLGIDNLDNTSDLGKPISTATANALSTKVDKTTTVNGQSLSSDVVLNKSDVGLSNVDNTSDASKPVSAAQQSALDTKVDKVNGKQLSTEDFTSSLKDKLTGLEGTHWRGTFVSLAALQAGVTDPEAGDYADVDAVGTDVERYIWDATDSAWVVQSGAVAPITASQVKQLYESNPDTNEFDDSAKSKLQGISDQATKNDTDANLKSRANHTGTQAISTVSGLQDALDGKEAAFAKNTAFNKNFGTIEGTVAQGNDTRITGAAQKSDNLSDLTNAATARTNLGLGTAATADVVQTLGASIVNVMSQDAITKEIKTIQDDIDELYTFNDLEDGLKWLTWDSASDTYSGNWGVTPVHLAMRRCVVDELSDVVYYLDPYDSTKKEDGSPANLDGTDGDVMVEIPQVWFKTVFNGTARTDYVSHKPRTGFTLHPRFRDGAVAKIYIGAYDASVWDASASDYIDGLNLDSNTSRIDLINDKLASVSGRFPMVGLTRAQFRTLASNASGTLEQFYEWQLLQLLFAVEYGNWNGQVVLARGNVDRSYTASSSNQADSPHTVAGLSNTLGNQSGGLDNSSGTPFMSYRGIENFWGNCWTFIDGINYLDRVSYVNDGSAPFADDTTTGYAQLGVALPESSGSYIKSWQNLGGVFVPASIGGTSSTYIGDGLWTSAGWRVAFVGGGADYGLSAGPAACSGSDVAGNAYRSLGSRLSREKLA